MLPTPGPCWSTSPDPEAVLAEMTRLVRAGGWVASLEPDVAVHLYHRANPAWDRLDEIFITAVQAVGADPFIGRRLPELFREAGLSDIGVRAHAELYPTGRPHPSYYPSGPRAQHAAQDHRVGHRQ